ncbi:prominin-1-A isoform X2 [Cotesia glomerata]|uniref:prominin-1-A isoform X2 n=1 Tax=Cotesia glomerata TaxID=32391 RepID=UPI001D003729|nr:prominin-1-A isoform X2 [Cotesia glomerata]
MLKVILISILLHVCLLLHVNAADNFNSEYIYQDETLNFNNYNNNYDTNYNLTTIITPLGVQESSLISFDGNENLTAGMDSHKMDDDLNIHKQVLQFPKIPYNQDFHISEVIKSANYSFYFNFLHVFIQFVQPYDIPSDLLKDILENRVTTSKLITESMHMEVGLLILVGVCSILACVIPGTELWLACRPIREDYKPTQYPGFLTFVLYILAFILGLGMGILILFNELTNMGMEKIPKTIDQAIDDLNNYHSGTTVQFRKCLTRSLDVASEAIMADLDNIDELLGKPVQIELSYETGLENTLTQLLDVANASQDIGANANNLIKNAETAKELTAELSNELNGIKRDLEKVISSCSNPQDRLLCSTINTNGLVINFQINKILRDERLLRLRSINRDNLTEDARRARGEYLYVPHHISRSTLDIKNQIRRELSLIRGRLFDETRNLESSNSHFNRKIESIKKYIHRDVVPYILEFEETRWLSGIATVILVFFVWILLVSALICRCTSSDNKIRTTLLCGSFFNCIISILLWLIMILMIFISTHTELILCRALEGDRNYKTLETIIESKHFLGKPLEMSLKDFIEKCEENEGVYPTYLLDNQKKLEEITDYWKWSGLTEVLSVLKADLKGLKILTSSFEGKLDSLMFACEANLTSYRTIADCQVRGSVVSRDIIALSEQIFNIARQINDRRASRELEAIGTSMRSLMIKKVKPLALIQDTIVDQLITLDIKLQPYQQRLNDTFVHLKSVQYYIDVQGEFFAQLKTKHYVERLNNYLDQWRKHVLTEMKFGIAKCRPLYNILQGFKILICQDILGPLDTFWFIIFLSIIIMMITTPIQHVLACVFKKFDKIIVFTPNRRRESTETIVIDRGNWRTPDPPPLPRRDDW